MHKLIVAGAAQAGLSRAVRWYKRERDGLGRELIGEIDKAFRAIARSPMQFPIVHRTARRALVARFPYGIVFVVEESEVVVLSVSHLHRFPASWQSRVPR